MSTKPRVAVDGLDATVEELFADQIEIVPWHALSGSSTQVDGVYTYGHPLLDGAAMDRLPGLRVISNYGVGVDHINLPDAIARGIPVGNTPGTLNGATADMGFLLMMAAARRLVEGDRYARSPKFTTYDPGYILGQEVHGTQLGIIGMGRIGEQLARRAAAFDMRICYHNRHRRMDAEATLAASHVGLDELLSTSDFVVACVPLTEETRGLLGARELGLMKSTAVLVNIARGPVVDTEALTAALQSRSIYAAGLDVTDPEPLPRDHPLLALENVVIAPHLGSATEQTRRRMAEASVENLMRGLRGEPLLYSV